MDNLDEDSQEEVNSQDAPEKEEYPSKEFYNEEEFIFRESNPKYQLYKQLEDRILQARNHVSSLKTYVICSGIKYGLGEDKLFDLFKDAWSGQKEALAYYGPGDNYIPMIHIKDLAMHVKHVVKHRPK